METSAELPEPSPRPSRRSRARDRARRIGDTGAWQATARGARLLAETARNPGRVLGIVFFASLLLRVLWLNVPSSGLIFDEAYYVNAARVILGIPAGTHYADAAAGFDP
ncbi:MAG TPA: hypothetical protein VKB00_02005, partial [Candidatus Limnocylindrales bacterium]|nr:hypothetical protein [Candidatus Limnocylindrales bacterium]